MHRALETFYSTPDFTQGDSDRYPTPSALTAYNKMREELKLKEQQPMPAEELATLSRQHPANKNIHIADMTFCLFALALGPRWNEVRLVAGSTLMLAHCTCSRLTSTSFCMLVASMSVHSRLPRGQQQVVVFRVVQFVPF